MTHPGWRLNEFVRNYTVRSSSLFATFRIQYREEVFPAATTTTAVGTSTLIQASPFSRSLCSVLLPLDSKVGGASLAAWVVPIWTSSVAPELVAFRLKPRTKAQSKICKNKEKKPAPLKLEPDMIHKAQSTPSPSCTK